MRLGLHVYSFTVDGGTGEIGPELARTGAAVEEAGLSWLSVMDHYFQMEAVAPATDPMLEAYGALTFLAAHTSTVQLGALVTGVTYRYPALLAKAVTTLDVLSGGRATLGVGAAWYEREHRGLGVPFPPVAERFERLEETLQVCLQMWDPGNDGPYEGRHYRLAETLCSPAPLSSPRPPILIGGSGERKTLRLVARYADACNLFADTPAQATHLLDVLRRHCDDVGRDEATIRKTMLYHGNALGPGAGGADAFLAEMEDYAKVGIETVMILAPGSGPSRFVEETCAPLVPRLAELGA